MSGVEHPLILLMILGDLIVAALIILVRGARGTVRTYTMSDGVLSVIEAALIVWGLLVLSGAL